MACRSCHHQGLKPHSFHGSARLKPCPFTKQIIKSCSRKCRNSSGRRKPEDKFLLVWFIVIYVVFTLISNKQWRYVTPLFPVLAISATALTGSAVGRAQKTWHSAKSSLTKVRVAKFAE